jgi:hypothetical protein
MSIVYMPDLIEDSKGECITNNMSHPPRTEQFRRHLQMSASCPDNSPAGSLPDIFSKARDRYLSKQYRTIKKQIQTPSLFELGQWKAQQAERLQAEQSGRKTKRLPKATSYFPKPNEVNSAHYHF